MALWECFGSRIFNIACAEQELKLQESDIPGAELPKPPEHCKMAILKRSLTCEGAKLSGKRKGLIKRSVRSWYIRRLLNNNISYRDLTRS